MLSHFLVSFFREIAKETEEEEKNEAEEEEGVLYTRGKIAHSFAT